MAKHKKSAATTKGSKGKAPAELPYQPPHKRLKEAEKKAKKEAVKAAQEQNRYPTRSRDASQQMAGAGVDAESDSDGESSDNDNTNWTAMVDRAQRRSRPNEPASAVSEQTESATTVTGKDEEDVDSIEEEPAGADDSSDEDGKWTGIAVLDLLYGAHFPELTSQNWRPVAEKIFNALKERSAFHNFVMEGRTTSYQRINLHFDSHDPYSFKQRLLKCFRRSAESQKKQVFIHQWLERELYYLVCWNLDAFPEISDMKDDGYIDTFPALFAGSYVSMFDVLYFEGLEFREIDFAKKQRTAALIFRTLLKRVQNLAPDSHLLVDRPLEGVTPPLDLFEKQIGEKQKAFKMRQQTWKILPKHAPENLLTLAFNTENFQTALVRTIENEIAKENATPTRRIRNEVEAMMYRLAKKEPRAFPEVFAVIDSNQEVRSVKKKDLRSLEGDASDADEGKEEAVLIDLL